MINRSIYEIEIALAKSDTFNYLRNIVAFNVTGSNAQLRIGHECDMLVLSKSGYLTEIEIKRTWQDFLNDFKKKHNHDGRGIMKYFYYCVPQNMVEKVYDKLDENKTDYSGVITYDEDLNLNFKGYRYVDHLDNVKYFTREMHPHRKLFIEEQLQVARFGAMRAIMLREKLIPKIE